MRMLYISKTNLGKIFFSLIKLINHKQVFFIFIKFHYYGESKIVWVKILYHLLIDTNYKIQNFSFRKGHYPGRLRMSLQRIYQNLGILFNSP